MRNFLCAQSTFYSIIKRIMRRMRENIYDNDNNIKPIEVNFNNNEYIIFFPQLTPYSSSHCWEPHDVDYRQTLLGNRNKIYLLSLWQNVKEKFLPSPPKYPLRRIPVLHTYLYVDMRTNSQKMIQILNLKPSTATPAAQFYTLRNDIFLIGIWMEIDWNCRDEQKGSFNGWYENAPALNGNPPPRVYYACNVYDKWYIYEETFRVSEVTTSN